MIKSRERKTDNEAHRKFVKTRDSTRSLKGYIYEICCPHWKIVLPGRGKLKAFFGPHPMLQQKLPFKSLGARRFCARPTGVKPKRVESEGAKLQQSLFPRDTGSPLKEHTEQVQNISLGRSCHFLLTFPECVEQI